ncbi:MAG TPA: SpoIIE family protein phosphatase [Spirochaetota bacterium]|nr:SpoIIE family protein phosphatase [Spirochaetota bacterium]
MEIKTSQKTSVLRKLPIFYGLSDNDLCLIAPILKLITFKSGESVIYEGDKGDSLFIIRNGSVEVFKTNGVGEEVSLGVLEEGSFFGELSLFDDHPRSATVKTLEYTDFFTLSRKDLYSTLDGHHEIENILYRNTIMETFSRFRKVITNFTFSQHHLSSRDEIISEINRDLKTATEIQEYFIRAEDDNNINLKHGISRSFIYLPSKAIGGDFISTMNDRNGNICAIIADVEGHGISASLVTGVLKSAFSFLAPEYGNRPDIFMAHLNRHLCSMLNRLYATCYYAYINVSDNTISFAKAGHHHPLFWRSAEKSFESIDVPGPLLGLLQEAEFGTETYKLNPGDKILFYTDGIIEERDERSQMFGIERLEEMFRNAIAEKSINLIDHIIVELNSHVNKDTYEDDITLLLYEFNQPALS